MNIVWEEQLEAIRVIVFDCYGSSNDSPSPNYRYRVDFRFGGNGSVYGFYTDKISAINAAENLANSMESALNENQKTP